MIGKRERMVLKGRWKDKGEEAKSERLEIEDKKGEME